ncbi:hypothetical protein [Solibacillus sp. FSL H8-0538]|uniref:hypothetical protein n=1 Tax=Solibacillus sp. FSL H8-0538 TaxID=2921400 RepID=UPI0030F8DA91
MMKLTKRVAIIVMGILCIVLLTKILKKDLWSVNAELFKEEFLSISQSVETVNLLNITPFEWDRAYSFNPYTPEDLIYETVGYKWDNISETVNEGMNQIVFLNDEKVVCYIYGYPENNGYGLAFITENYTEVASILNVKDELDFHVTRSESVIYLRND